jgi:hypothetical protein
MCRLLPVLIFTIVASAAFAGQKFDFEQFRDRLPWIWQSPQPVDPPKVQDAAWPTDPIDNPLSPPSDPVQIRLQSPPAKSKFLAVSISSLRLLQKAIS